jgi:hypothetical protein
MGLDGWPPADAQPLRRQRPPQLRPHHERHRRQLSPLPWPGLQETHLRPGLQETHLMSDFLSWAVSWAARC